jgi:hypothetical protein
MFSPDGSASKVNTPYNATVTTTQEKELADGSVVRSSVTTHQARDSAGRTRTESSLECQPGSDGVSHRVFHIGVYDPTTGTSMIWTPDDPAKVLRVLHESRLPPVAKPVLAKPDTNTRHDAKVGRGCPCFPVFRTEDLGNRSIAGVIADGTRLTNKIPAGVGGKGQPSKNVREIWVARGLGLWMLRIEENPIKGRTTTEVVDLNQGEPDASLFTPPAGYKLEGQGSVKTSQ